MGSLSSVDAEIGRLAQAMESYVEATGPVRTLLRELAPEEAVAAPAAPAVVAALSALDARLADLGTQTGEAAGVLRALQDHAADHHAVAARRDAADGALDPGLRPSPGEGPA